MPDEPTSDFFALLRALLDARVEFAVVGGTAAVLHGASTATYDLDIVMAFSEANCTRLLTALVGTNPRLSHTADKRPLRLSATELASFRNLYLTTDLGRLDVLGSLPPAGEAKDVLASAVLMRLDDQHLVPVVSLEMLIAVKAALGRPKDKQTEVELRAISEARQKVPE